MTNSDTERTLQAVGDRSEAAGGDVEAALRGLPNRLGLAAFVVGLLALTVRASVIRDAFFLPDDYMLTSRAVENDLTLDYLTRVHTGHFEPIGFTVMWLHANYATFSWGWAAVFLLGCQAILFVMVWKLLTELFGRRWLALVPFSSFCFSSLTVAAFTFLSAAIIWLPLMIAMAGVLRFHVRFIREGRRRDAWYALAWMVVGMASFEKIVILLPFLILFTLALEGSYRQSARPTLAMLRRQAPIWIGYATLSVIYVLLYLRGASHDGASSDIDVPPAVDVGDYVALTFGRTVVPGLFGGPWAWTLQPPYSLAYVDSPRLFDWVTWALFLALLVGSLVFRRRIALYWVSLLIYLLSAMAIIAVGRVPYLGAVFGLETRYVTDAVIPIVVILGCCLMPLAGERQPLTAEGAAFIAPRAQYLRWGVLGIAGVVAVLSLNSISRYTEFTGDNPTKAFLAKTKASLAALPDDAQIVDTAVPDGILTALFTEYNNVSRFIAPLVTPEQREDMYSRRTYTHPYVMANDGTFVPMDLGVITATDGPPGWCWSNEAGTITVPLASDAYVWHWVARLGYLSTSEATGLVALGGEPEPVQFSNGLGEVWVSLVGGGDELTVTGLPADARICVGDATVGTPRPAVAQ